MKKFKFSLDAVKGYKEKLLENIKIEYSAIAQSIIKQQKLIRGMEESERIVNSELNDKNSEGIAPHELMNYQRYLKVLQNDIKFEYEKLARLKKTEEAKRKEMVEMKKETASFEKLEEKKLAEYDYLARKEQEIFIEEFVSNQKYSDKP
jgi:flagellar FliJ protein